ncbi:MAG: replication initiation protein [Chromatiales bacterium]|nr:MAG: replication initiation protein [Chromatiales bacterium]
MSRLLIIVLSMLLWFANTEAREPSVCYGSTANGRLENGWRLPSGGANFQSYSTMGGILGRTYVHSWVHSVVLEAYSELQNTQPDTIFVYGETGKKKGGEFEPHKTHRNGLSVDFMVPVRNDDGDSVPLPTSVLNKWGYDLEFDSEGRLDDLRIDFDALAEHIYQLHRKAKENGGDIWRVILAPELQPHLHHSPRWPYLETNVQFSTGRSWVRHDEHYHVDFVASCEPET